MTVLRSLDTTTGFDQESVANSLAMPSNCKNVLVTKLRNLVCREKSAMIHQKPTACKYKCIYIYTDLSMHTHIQMTVPQKSAGTATRTEAGLFCLTCNGMLHKRSLIFTGPTNMDMDLLNRG